MREPLGKSEPFNKGSNLLFVRFSAVKKQGQGEIFLYRKNRNQIIKLIDKSYLPRLNIASAVSSRVEMSVSFIMT